MKFIPFAYLDVSLKESVYINGIPYFTKQAIGEWLDYEHPRRSIDIIIQRNSHIDDPEWATDISLMSVEGNRPVTRNIKVYNPIGLQLIVFESRQPKAIEYKIAVAKLVADMASGRFFLNNTLDLINSIQPYKSKYSKPDDKPRKRFALWPESEGSAKLENPSNFSKRLKT